VKLDTAFWDSIKAARIRARSKPTSSDTRTVFSRILALINLEQSQRAGPKAAVDQAGDKIVIEESGLLREVREIDSMS
jgi:hypothetical protein